MDVIERAKPLLNEIFQGRQIGLYPYFRTIDVNRGTEVEVTGKTLVMAGSNDYLGLSQHPRVKEAAAQAALKWGTGTGGSRFLSGNLALHEQLEQRLAQFVGKRYAVVHATGFTTNLGALSCLLDNESLILCDRENHASIFEGCRASGARVIPFRHNDFGDAARKLEHGRRRNPDGGAMAITEGVFSMSGDLADLPSMVALKDGNPDLMVYLDDAHGLGVMGPGGRGTMAHFDLTEKVDFVMGTFSKALASVGGFLAGDNEILMELVRHQSRPLIFSAALPAPNCATVLACLDLLEAQPEMVARLMDISDRVRQGYRDIGLYVRESVTPVIPIYIGNEYKAFLASKELFDMGVFALPAVYPAVPKGQAVIRTAFMSTHEDRHITHVLEAVEKLADKLNIRVPDLLEEGALNEAMLAAASFGNEQDMARRAMGTGVE